MEAYQQRVVDEKTELDAKIEKLLEFRASPNIRIVSPEARNLLRRQALAMQEYSDVLGERIAQFLNSPDPENR